MIEFFLPMQKIPTTTHQQKKVNVQFGKPIFYEPEDLKNARAKFESLLAQHVPFWLRCLLVVGSIVNWRNLQTIQR